MFLVLSPPAPSEVTGARALPGALGRARARQRVATGAGKRRGQGRSDHAKTKCGGHAWPGHTKGAGGPAGLRRESPFSRHLRELLGASLQRVQPSLHSDSAAAPNAESLVRSQGTGDPRCWGESHGETVGSAGSFSASPSANPAGRRKRLSVRFEHVAQSVCSMLFRWPARPRPRPPTGGASPGAAHPATPPTAPPAARPSAATRPRAAPHRAGHLRAQPSLAYHGPVYEKTATGQVVPYVAPHRASGRNVGCGAHRRRPAGAARRPASPSCSCPGTHGRVVNGLAAAPMAAPPAVQEIIWAANEIIGAALHLGRRPRLVHLARLRLLGHRLLRPARRQPARHARWTPRNSKAGARTDRALGHRSSRTPATPT